MTLFIHCPCYWISESWKVYAGMQDVWKMQCDEHSKHAFAVGCVTDVLCLCVCVLVACKCTTCTKSLILVKQRSKCWSESFHTINDSNPEHIICRRSCMYIYLSTAAPFWALAFALSDLIACLLHSAPVVSHVSTIVDPTSCRLGASPWVYMVTLPAVEWGSESEFKSVSFGGEACTRHTKTWV